MKRVLALAVIALLAQGCAATAADASASSILAENETTDTNLQAQLYIAGEALSWANADMAVKANGKKLYCPPAGVRINGQRYAAIFNSYVKKKVWTQDLGPSSFEGYLLFALEDAFPCRD